MVMRNKPLTMSAGADELTDKDETEVPVFPQRRKIKKHFAANSMGW
jgi:hypothetical protein